MGVSKNGMGYHECVCKRVKPWEPMLGRVGKKARPKQTQTSVRVLCICVDLQKAVGACKTHPNW